MNIMFGSVFQKKKTKKKIMVGKAEKFMFSLFKPYKSGAF
jgi:hypothetical protein